MADAPETIIPTAQKRGPGRPSKSASIPNKRQKRDSVTAAELLITHDTPLNTPPPEKKLRGLPTKLHDTKPLPTLAQAQPLTLPDLEYASIATSGVLAKSLDQSRISWTQSGIFERYWTKPETGKNARPPPPNNPEIKSMKSKGKCRLRIEPHIFEVEVYVVEKPRPPAPQKQYLPPRPQGSFNQPWQNQQYQPQAPHNASGSTQVNVQPAATTIQSDKKPLPDPVIGLLATRAGSDPELKALMREVAAGHAPPEQLKVFQRHIDELNAVLHTQKPTVQEQGGKHAESNTVAEAAQPFVQQQQKQIQSGEVVFAFTTPGATSDRFLFPQHCILEALTPQHLLTSFVVTRKGGTAANLLGIDSSKDYWSPVTIMVEVAYGREGILKDVHRWVKSPDESREYMKKIMSEYERMPDTHLALCLPLRGTLGAESADTSKVSTPAPPVLEEVKRRQSRPVAARKRSSLAKGRLPEATIEGAGDATSAAASSLIEKDAVAVEKEVADVGSVAANGRPVRATRKSVRMSDY